MKFLNETPHAARFLKNISPRGRRMMGCVIARSLFDVGRDGDLKPVTDAPWPLDVTPVDTPLGKKPGDKPFYMGGIDVLLGGRVYQPDRGMQGRLDVEVEVGRTFRRRMAVFGDRRWVRAKNGELVPSEPETFGSMRLDFSLAYGGKAPGPEDALVPYLPNPLGRGYYLDEASAEGNALPNIEDPNHPVARWDDRPTPVGLGYYPESGSLRPQSAIRLQPDAKEPPTAADLLPTLFNQAHPDMVIEAMKGPKPGDLVRLSHGRKGGEDLAFVLPTQGFHLYVQLEERQHAIPLHLDQIGILGGEERVLLSYRVVFEYRLVRAERRVATLYTGPAPDPIPAHYRREIKDEWDEAAWMPGQAGQEP